MDHIKHEVKMSKTTEKIEKYATLYEQAVGDFDAQANRVLIKLNQLPSIKLAHEVLSFDTVLQCLICTFLLHQPATAYLERRREESLTFHWKRKYSFNA